MIRWSMYGLCLSLVVSGCGEQTDESQGDCGAEPQRVMVSISSNFPALLEPSECPASRGSDLEAFLLMRMKEF